MAKNTSPLFATDVRNARKKVADRMYQVANLLSEVDRIVEDVSANYDFKEDVFNDCLPLDNYPFDKSFDEMPSAIIAWADSMVEMNDQNQTYN